MTVTSDSHEEFYWDPANTNTLTTDQQQHFTGWLHLGSTEQYCLLIKYTQEPYGNTGYGEFQETVDQMLPVSLWFIYFKAEITKNGHKLSFPNYIWLTEESSLNSRNKPCSVLHSVPCSLDSLAGKDSINFESQLFMDNRTSFNLLCKLEPCFSFNL